MQKKTKLLTSLVVAGKLASSAHLASAEGLGKTGSADSSLSLDQIGFPLTILTPPINEDLGSTVQSTPSGTIFSADSDEALNSSIQPRIDFVINNIQSNSAHPVVVFLAYSTVKGDPSQWQDFSLNDLSLDRETFKIISAFQVQSNNNAFGEFNVSATPLGTINNNGRDSIVVSLNLNDLNHPDFEGNNIYFQVVAIPLVNGEFDFSAASTSELDHYQISRHDPNQPGSGSKLDNTDSGSTDSGTKGDTSSGGDTGGK